MFFLKKKDKMTEAKRSYYYNLLDSIMKLCWNYDTGIFNWEIWKKREDELIWCGDDFILKAIDDEFRAYGRLQIVQINAWLENSFSVNGCEVRKEVVNKLLGMEKNILRNLCGMFSMQQGRYVAGSCPKDVRMYCDNVYRLLRGQVEWSKENVRRIVGMGRMLE